MLIRSWSFIQVNAGTQISQLPQQTELHSHLPGRAHFQHPLESIVRHSQLILLSHQRLLQKVPQMHWWSLLVAGWKPQVHKVVSLHLCMNLAV